MDIKNLPHKESPSQTAGPYVHIGLAPNFSGIRGVYPCDLGTSLMNDTTRGERIIVTGRVFDGEGALMSDVLIETWQADHEGSYDNPGFQGWGRYPCDLESGVFRFETIKPGSVENQAPHLSFWFVARGINIGLSTRMYFPEEQANGEDAVLGLLIDEPARLNTLIAVKTGNIYTFDIHVQGERETVFFDI